MGALSLLLHPNQLRAVIQWKLWHNPVHKRDASKEPETLKECFRLLDLTSRSFAVVIQELTPELLVPIVLFYLALRGLDTIEDDMTIPIEKKVPLLRDFHKNLDVDGWHFRESNEKDRELLDKFDVVITELRKIKPRYYAIIKDVTLKMGNGMADYVQNDDVIKNGVQSIEDYELYCHYVAGLVGEGLTRFFVESGLGHPKLAERPTLTESMGQFLQKTNIIRDLHEDWQDGRRWYPKEIWSRHVDKWEHLFDPRYEEQALNCVSDMVLDAMKHVEECLFYMAGMREQSAFNFVAIPQGMAIASMESLFRNRHVLSRHVKLSRGDACQIMMDCTQNLQTLCDVFRRYVRKIQKKNDPKDPNYLNISVRCAKIEQFIETLFPTQDPGVLAAAAENSQADERQQQQQPGMSTGETAVMLGVVLLALACVSGLMIGTAWLMGARFPNVFKDATLVVRQITSPGASSTGRDEL